MEGNKIDISEKISKYNRSAENNLVTALDEHKRSFAEVIMEKKVHKTQNFAPSIDTIVNSAEYLSLVVSSHYSYLQEKHEISQTRIDAQSQVVIAELQVPMHEVQMQREIVDLLKDKNGEVMLKQVRKVMHVAH